MAAVQSHISMLQSRQNITRFLFFFSLITVINTLNMTSSLSHWRDRCAVCRIICVSCIFSKLTSIICIWSALHSLHHRRVYVNVRNEMWCVQWHGPIHRARIAIAFFWDKQCFIRRVGLWLNVYECTVIFFSWTLFACTVCKGAKNTYRFVGRTLAGPSSTFLIICVSKQWLTVSEMKNTGRASVSSVASSWDARTHTGAMPGHYRYRKAATMCCICTMYT